MIIWDAHSGKELHTFDDHQGDVTRMIWSPTSQWFATASRDRMVRIWNLSERSERHAGGIRSIAFNPVDDRFASAGDDRTVKLWKSPNGGFIDTLRHRADVGSLCFDPTGQFLATGCSNGFVVLWDIATPNSKLIAKHTVHTGAVRCVVFSPDGRQLASAGIDKTIYLWPIEGSSEPKPFTRQDSEINFIAYRPNRSRIASGAADGTITLLDLESAATASLGNIPDEVICLAFSPDGQRLASVRSDGTVRVWDLDSETEMAKSTHPGATAVLFSPDGKRVFVSTSEGSVKIIDARTGFSLLTLTGQSPLNCLALNVV